ncbi:ankyrin repeat domain-containing protein [Streptomyces polyrhachis]|uniref:Ankyrin repeat domain-containing protein n=1 Tax=Streptomyces polyrhachis TaxID=1282885 RepID=A0ABW2GKZ9_9ACTN
MDRSAQLLDAVYDGDLPGLTGLLEGADDPPGALRAALYEAAVEGRADLVHVLLEHGADPDAPGVEPQDGLPLCAAACWGHTDVVGELLQAGADAARGEWDGNTAVLWAAANGHTATLRLLLSRSFDTADRTGRTVTAVTDDSGRTPLHRAAARGSLQAVEALLEADADWSVRDDEGLTPRQTALAWVDVDLAAEVRHRARILAEAEPGDRVVVREEVAPDDSTVLVAEVVRDGEPRAWTDLQTGHAAVADLLASYEER